MLSTKAFELIKAVRNHNYKQLLRAQIPSAQKRQSSQQYRLALLGPTSLKAARKTLVKLIPALTFNS